MNQRELTAMIAGMHSTASILDSLSEARKTELGKEDVAVLGYDGVKDVVESIRTWANTLIELTPNHTDIYVD